MKKKSTVFLVVFVTIVVVLTVMFSVRQVKYEKGLAINFEVDRVETTPALRSILYDKNGNKLRLQRFVLFDRHGIEPGDIIIKESDSEVLKVFRTDSLGNKDIHLILDQK